MYDKKEPSVLFHALHHAHKRQVMAEQRARGLEDLGAPVILLTLFHAERKGEKLSQRELAGRLRLSPATVAVSLQNMEKGGYVRREIDPHDARRNLVSLTPKGKEAMETCGEAFRAADREMLSDFTPEEEEQLTGFFIRMLKNLGVTDPEKGPPPFPPPPHGPGGHEPKGGPKECPPHRQRKKEGDRP